MLPKKPAEGITAHSQVHLNLEQNLRDLSSSTRVSTKQMKTSLWTLIISQMGLRVSKLVSPL